MWMSGSSKVDDGLSKRTSAPFVALLALLLSACDDGAGSDREHDGATNGAITDAAGAGKGGASPAPPLDAAIAEPDSAISGNGGEGAPVLDARTEIAPALPDGGSDEARDGSGDGANSSGADGCPHDVCRFASVGLGSGRSCTVDWEGHARCWGRNQAASTLPPGTYRQVWPFGERLTIALRTDGRVIFAGENLDQPVPRDDQLSTLSSSEYATGSCGLRPDRTISCWGQFPVTPPPPGPFAEVTVTGEGACALRDDGTAACWQLTGDLQLTPPPGPFKQVRGNGGLACGITRDDVIVCWGPRAATVSPPAGRFRKLEMSDRVCALSMEGAVVCWDTSPASPPYTTPSGLYVDFHFRSGQGCGVRRDGSFDCWGFNQFGEGSLPERDSFIRISQGCALDRAGGVECWNVDWQRQPAWPAGPFVDIDGVARFGCALTGEGVAKCWSNETFTPPPLEPPAGHRYSKVRAVNRNICGILRDTQALECWGEPLPFAQQPPLGKFTDFLGGGPEGCGIRSDGRIQCWDTDGQSAVVRGTVPAGTFKQVIYIATGAGCALSTAGEVSCWGFVPNVPAAPLGPFVQIAPSGDGVVALRPDGALVSFGFGRPPVLPSGKFVQLSTRSCALDDVGALKCWGEVFR